MAEFKEEYRYEQYGGLTVLAPYGSYSTYNDGVVCSCVCGEFCVRSLYKLLTKHTGSCGCRTPSRSLYNIYKEYEDGYAVFMSVQKRCKYFNITSRKSYFDKGVSLEGDWANEDPLKAFTAFVNDMGRRPTPDHEIDRIDCNGNYSKENCRWVTRGANALNKGNTKFVVVNGEKIPLKFLADAFKLNVCTVRDRVFNRLPFYLVFTRDLRQHPDYKLLKKSGFRFLDFSNPFPNIVHDTDIDLRFEKQYGEYVVNIYKEFMNG